jgi:hypothetical protein
MTAEVPAFPGLRVASGTSPAKWVAERLWPGRTLKVGSVVPDAYPSYGRLLHPARSARPDGPDEIRWSAIAAEHGMSIDSGVRFRDLVGWRDGPGPPFPYSAPLRGSHRRTKHRSG